MKCHPHDAEAVHALVRAHCLQGELQIGCDRYRDFLDKGGQDDTGCLNNLAVLLFEQGCMEAALQTFHTARKISPDDWRIAANLALVLADLEQLDDAEPVLRQLCKKQPRDQALKLATDVVLNQVPYPAYNSLLAATSTVQVFPFLHLVGEGDGTVLTASILDSNDRSIRLKLQNPGDPMPVFFAGRQVILGGLQQGRFVGLKTRVLGHPLGTGQTLDLLRPAGLHPPQRRSRYRMQIRNVLQAISVESGDPLTAADWEERDISAGGMSFRLTRALAANSRLNIRLKIGEATFDCEAVVIDCQPSCHAGYDVRIQFVRPRDDLFLQLAQKLLTPMEETDERAT